VWVASTSVSTRKNEGQDFQRKGRSALGTGQIRANAGDMKPAAISEGLAPVSQKLIERDKARVASSPCSSAWS